MPGAPGLFGFLRFSARALRKSNGSLLTQVADADPFLGRGQDQCGQATKGVWGMSRRQQAKKGVEDCDKPGEAVKRALIPGCPNDRVVNP